MVFPFRTSTIFRVPVVTSAALPLTKKSILKRFLFLRVGDYQGLNSIHIEPRNSRNGFCRRSDLALRQERCEQQGKYHAIRRLHEYPI